MSHAAGTTAIEATSSAAMAAQPQPLASPPVPPVKPPDPNMDHLHTSIYEHVYEPAEDSFLLMDALYEDLARNGTRAALQSEWPLCLEVGPGSGIIITYLSNILARRGFFLAVDVNPHAARTTRATMRANRVCGDVLQGDLLESFAPRLRGKVDILIFNPPYVPTPPEEMLGEGISRSWAGGVKGREILDRLLPEVQHLLSPRGVFYCVLLSSNVPEEVAAIMREHGDFEATMVLRRRAGIEDLQIVRYARPAIAAIAATAGIASTNANASASSEDGAAHAQDSSS